MKFKLIISFGVNQIKERQPDRQKKTEKGSSGFNADAPLPCCMEFQLTISRRYTKISILKCRVKRVLVASCKMTMPWSILFVFLNPKLKTWRYYLGAIDKLVTSYSAALYALVMIMSPTLLLLWRADEWIIWKNTVAWVVSARNQNAANYSF